MNKHQKHNLDVIANDHKNFRKIEPEGVIVLNAKGEKKMKGYLDGIFNDIVKETLE